MLKPLRDADNWWFGKGSPVALGVFRIVISLLTFSTLGLTLFDFEAWYTDKGFVPLDVISKNWINIGASFQLGPDHLVDFHHAMPRVSLLSYVHDSRISLAFYLIVMLSALTTAVGLWSRLSSVVLAVGVVSIHHRDPLILHSGDTLLRLMLIYLAWSPCGAACSLDRVIRLWKGKAEPEPPLVSLWPQKLIQYQIALVYFTTVWWKWFGTYWKDGTATWYPENLNEFYRFPVPGFLHHQPFLAVTTYGTLVVELSLATLVFYKPLRKYVLLAGIFMHGYIEYRMNIPFFAAIIVSGYLCFYEGDEVSGWARRMGDRLRRLRVLVQLPQGFRMRPGPGMALAAMDPFSLVAYDAGTGPGWKGFDLEARSKRPILGSWIRSLGAWPLGLVPMLWGRLLRSSLEPVEPVEIAAATNGRGPATPPSRKAER